MNGTPLNILELLNGSNQLLSNDKALALFGEAEMPSISFDELIANYMEKGESGDGQKILELLGVSDDASAPIGLLSNDTLVFSKLLGNENLKEANNIESRINNEDVPEILNPSEDISDDVANFNKELQQLNLNSKATINSNIKTLLNSKPIDLSDGTYEILKSKIDGSQMNLELKQDNNETVKLSIPLELINTGSLKSNLTNEIPTRLNLDGLDKDNKQLFSNVKLKEIIIENVKPESDVKIENKTENIKLNIIAENQGQKIVIKNNLNKLHIKQEISSETKPFSKSDFVLPQTEENEIVKTAKENPKNNIETDAKITNKTTSANTYKGGMLDKNNTWNEKTLYNSAPNKIDSNINGNIKDNLLNQQGMFDQFNNKAGNFVESAKLENSELFFNTAQSELNETSEIKQTRVQPVRFILPENLKTTLKPNGQSVMLRIEPDHLGPARLNLSMLNNKLKARLVVNSHAARTVLEGSVEKLVEQLNKADIKVDSIDITVSSDAAKDDLNQHQSHWQRHILSKNMKFNDNLLNPDKTHEVIQPVTLKQEYINAGGVNLLA